MRVTLRRVAETFSVLRFWFFQLILTLSPPLIVIYTTISAGIVLWLYTVKLTSALYPLLLQVFRLVISLLAVISKALPVFSVNFQSLGVWSILSYPINSREPSESSVLNTLKIPLGRAIPKPFALMFWNSSRLAALRLFCVYRPELMVIRLYFLMGTLQTLGMNSTCFCELSLRETGSLRVQRWKSEKDFSLKEGAPLATALYNTMPSLALLELETVFTSPAISLSLALEQRLPLLLSMVTHPPISPLLSSELRVKEQSDFQEKPLVRQATSQSVVSAVLLNTCQLSVGSVKNPVGREGKLTASTLFKTQIPFFVLRMYPSLQPSSVPLILQLSPPKLAQTTISLSMYFWRMPYELMRLASKFCQQTLTLSGEETALKVTVSGWILLDTSVKESWLLPTTKVMERTSLTMANRSLYIVTARETAELTEVLWAFERRVRRSNSPEIRIIYLDYTVCATYWTISNIDGAPQISISRRQISHHIVACKIHLKTQVLDIIQKKSIMSQIIYNFPFFVGALEIKDIYVPLNQDSGWILHLAAQKGSPNIYSAQHFNRM